MQASRSTGSTEMRLHPISQKLKVSIDTIRDRITKGQTKHVMENSNGWRYGGDGFMELVGTLQEDIQAELKEHALHVNIVVSPLA